jgi:hypothetical protein
MGQVSGKHARTIFIKCPGQTTAPFLWNIKMRKMENRKPMIGCLLPWFAFFREKLLSPKQAQDHIYPGTRRARFPKSGTRSAGAIVFYVPDYMATIKHRPAAPASCKLGILFANVQQSLLIHTFRNVKELV